MSTIERLNKEKEIIGIFLSAHPLDDYEFEVKDLSTIRAKDLAFFESIRKKESRDTFTKKEEDPDPLEYLKSNEGKVVKIGGILTKADMGTDKNGKAYGRFTLEDYTGTYNFAMFSENYARNSAYMRINQFIFIEGVIEQRGASWSKYFKRKDVSEADYEFNISKVEYLQDAQDHYAKSITLSIPISVITPQFTKDVNEMLAAHQGTITREVRQKNANPLMVQENTGKIKVMFVIHDEINRNVVTMACTKYAVKMDPELYRWLKIDMKDLGVTYKVN